MQRLDGTDVRAWAHAATAALSAARARIDAVNVFPVADSDTGTNVLLTVAGGADAVHVPVRADCGAAMVQEAAPGDRILILGARDDTLTDFGRELLEKLASRA